MATLEPEVPSFQSPVMKGSWGKRFYFGRERSLTWEVLGGGGVGAGGVPQVVEPSFWNL